MVSTANERYVFWLLPAGVAEEFFAEIITRFASRYDGPMFAPHLTLTTATRGEAENLLARVAARPLQLHVAGVHSSAAFFKTLFVRFQPNEELRQLVRALDAEANLEEFDPHVSLLYADLPLAEKEKLAAATALPFRETHFDRVRLMRCPDVSETRAAVESWREVTTRELAE